MTVATTGTWNIHPNVYNAVPRGASILLDIRDVDFDRRQQVIDAVLKGAHEIGEKWNTPTKADIVYAHPPITSADKVGVAASRRSCDLQLLEICCASAWLLCSHCKHADVIFLYALDKTLPYSPWNDNAQLTSKL